MPAVQRAPRKAGGVGSRRVPSAAAVLRRRQPAFSQAGGTPAAGDSAVAARQREQVQRQRLSAA